MFKKDFGGSLIFQKITIMKRKCMIYTTKDLTEITVLNHLNYTIRDFKKEGRSIYFTFEGQEEDLKTTIEDLKNNNLAFEPNSFLFSFKQTKQRIGELLNSL